MPRMPIICLLTICLASTAQAQNALARWEITRAYATFHCAGVMVSYQGDQNQNATGKLEYRKVDEDEWRQAHPLVRIKGGPTPEGLRPASNRLVGSIFYLEPDTSYELRVAITDPDGAPGEPKTTTVRTRSETIPLGGGREYWVAPDGDDNAAGREAAPFRTIQHAADLAGPGDTVWVKPGVYREEVHVTRSGRPDAHIAFSASLEGAIIQGDDDAFAEGRVRWRDEGQGIWSAPCASEVGYVAAGERRLYHYLSLDDVKQQYEGVTGGWFYDEQAKQLYVRMPDGQALGAETLHVAQRDSAFRLSGASYVLIEGFDLGYFGRGPYGTAIDLNNSSACVVRRNRIHHCRTGVRIRGEDASENLVQSNEIYDTELSDWPWNRVKGTDGEGGGVSLRAGIGNVVRGNVISGFFNGIVPSLWGDLENEAFNPELDVYENVIYHIGDDPMEPEGACINQRFFHNQTRDTLMGISIAPVTVGPTWVIRNEFVDFWASSYKFSVNTSGPCLIYHNSAYTARPDTNGMEASGNWHGMVFRNNIVQGARYAIEDMVDSSSNDLDYDCWYTTRTDGPRFKWQNIRYNTWDDLAQAAGLEKHGLFADPRFTDPAQSDLSLAADSPCLDVGMIIPNINDGYVGKGPDLGARERRD